MAVLVGDNDAVLIKKMLLTTIASTSYCPPIPDNVFSVASPAAPNVSRCLSPSSSSSSISLPTILYLGLSHNIYLIPAALAQTRTLIRYNIKSLYTSTTFTFFLTHFHFFFCKFSHLICYQRISHPTICFHFACVSTLAFSDEFTFSSLCVHFHFHLYFTFTLYSYFHFLTGCLNLGSAACSSCQVNKAETSMTIRHYQFNHYLYFLSMYITESALYLYFLSSYITALCILTSCSAPPPTLPRFPTLIFPSPPHPLLQSGQHCHQRHNCFHFVIIIVVILYEMSS